MAIDQTCHRHRETRGAESAKSKCAVGGTCSRRWIAGRVLDPSWDSVQILSTTTFTASFAYPMASGALKFRADLNERSATGRASGLALLFSLLILRLRNGFASIVPILELHFNGSLLADRLII